MKKILILIFIPVACAGVPVFATPSIEFSPDPSTAGNWYYDGAGTLSFSQTIAVDRAVGSNADPLVGATVYIPTFTVSTNKDGTYQLTPLGSSIIEIKSADGSQTYLKGTLASGDLVGVGTIGAAYSCFTADISNLIITSAGQALGSAALSSIIKSGTPTLDFEISLQGASGVNYSSLAEMIAGGYVGSNGFSGAMSIPEPATIAMLGFGALTLLRRRKR